MTETLSTYKELRRSRDDRMLGGVCGGLGHYFNVNPAFYRVGFVILSLLGGAGIVVYGACLLVIPNEGEQDSIATEALRDHRRRPAALVGLVLVAVAGIALLSHVSFRIDNDALWAVVLVVGAALLWSQRREPRAQPPAAAPPVPGQPVPPTPGVPAPPPAPRRRSILPLALGGLVVAGGILGLLTAADVDVPWAISLAVAAVALGIAVVVGAVNRQRVGGVAALGIVLAFGAIAATSVDMHLEDGIGHDTYHPLTTADIRSEYRLGIGEIELDLSDVALPAGQTRIEVEVGIGHVDVLLPREGAVNILGHAKWGEVNLPDELGADGRDVSAEFGESSAQLVIDARVGAGRIDVYRAVR